MKISARIHTTGIAPIITLVLIIVFFISCRPAPVSQQEAEPNAALAVYFFHLTERCEVCKAIEETSARILDKDYSSQLKNGIIKFKSVNIENRENRGLTDKYKISYTSLLLVRADGTVTDFTNTALNYAYLNPSKFEELLKAEIDKNLK